MNLNIYEKLELPEPVLDNPVAVAFLTTLTAFQFVFTMPPFIFTAILWFVSGVALSFILKKTVTRFQYRNWRVFFLMGSISMFLNLVLLHSFAETWILILAALATVGFGFYTIINRYKLEDKFMIWVIYVVIGFEVAGLILIVTNNYNSAKTFIINGILIVLIGYLVFNAYRLFKTILKFSEYLKESEDARSLTELAETRQKITSLSVIVFVVALYFLINRSSYFFQRNTEPLKNLIYEPIGIGTFQFTLQGIFVFIAVIAISTVIAHIVSLLSAETGAVLQNTKKTGPGSWLLLIRIAIITSGMIIAFVSIGIHVDRLVVIISALGVGIGFGLQAVVNNLISGVIIAFEKPVNLNDIVEVGSQTGKVKSIGLRSSVVTTYDGADVVIPNGDLLNQHLVNWTMGTNRRRFEFTVGVAYDTDLQKARKIIQDELKRHKTVLKTPDPVIWVTNFNDSSIDLIVKFWVRHFDLGFEVKSELMIEISKAFAENGIVIPFSKYEL